MAQGAIPIERYLDKIKGSISFFFGLGGINSFVVQKRLACRFSSFARRCFILRLNTQGGSGLFCAQMPRRFPRASS
jgi:hypothetical protein